MPWDTIGLKAPQKQPKKGRLWFNDGSFVRLRPERPHYVWSYGFVESRKYEGRRFRMLNLLDDFTRECLAIRIDRHLRSTDVIDVLSDQFILRGRPDNIRSDNGQAIVAKAVKVDRRRRRPNGLHLAGKPIGEWLLRELQREAQG